MCIKMFLVAVIIPSIEIGHKIPNESFCILNVLKKMCQLIIRNLMAPEEKKTSYNNQYVLSYLMIFLTLKSKVSNYMNWVELCKFFYTHKADFVMHFLTSGRSCFIVGMNRGNSL